MRGRFVMETSVTLLGISSTERCWGILTVW
jgi:hypothetical protein